MGQKVRGEAEATALSRDPERSIGAYLARQRELRGFTLDDLANQTRIPRRSLERLESGVFDRAPDGFVRGFVRTVAAALGLDPDEAVMRLLREPEEEAAREDASRRLRAGPGLRGAALLLFGALLAAGLVWLIATRTGRPATAPGADVVLRPDPVRALARDLEAGRIHLPAPPPAAAQPKAAPPETPAGREPTEAARPAAPPVAPPRPAAPAHPTDPPPPEESPAMGQRLDAAGAAPEGLPQDPPPTAPAAPGTDLVR